MGSVLAIFATAVVVAGSDYGVVWLDSPTNQFRYRRVSTGGAPLGPSVTVTASPAIFFNPALAWNGAEYGLAWLDFRDDDIAVYFRRFGLDGTILSSEIRLSDPMATAGFVVAGDVELAWLGDRWAAAATDFRDGDASDEVRLSFADASGAKLGSDVLVSAPADGASSTVPALAAQAGELLLAWQDAGDGLLLSSSARTPQVSLTWDGASFLAAWVDNQDGNQEIYTASVSAAGVLLAGPHRISEDAAVSNQPVIAAGPGGPRLVVWQDSRGTAPELWSALLDATGARSGAETALTADDGVMSNQPDLASQGSEFGLVWIEFPADEIAEAHFRRLSAAGLPLGSPVKVSEVGTNPRLIWNGDRWGIAHNGSGGAFFAELDASGAIVSPPRAVFRLPNGLRRPAVDWDGERFVLAVIGGYREPDAELFVTSVACAADDTPPTCPTSLTGATEGNSLRLAWQRGSDGDGALRWQYLVRDGERFAALTPDATTFADDLPPPGAHTYSVISVNQGLREATACPEVTVVFSAVIFADGFETGDASAWSSTSP